MTRGLPALVPIVVAGLAALLLVTVAAHAPEGSLADVLLGAGPVAWLGRISYSLYLWHEVAYRLAEQLGPRGSAQVEVLRFVLAVAFAAASYYWVEQPAQRWWSNRRDRSTRDADRVLVSAA
jgi:peptidoglycan/LPS O-acetylase OafA/YrhL